MKTLKFAIFAAAFALASALVFSCAEPPESLILDYEMLGGGNSSSSWGSDAPQSPMPFRDVAATHLVSYMKAGWNLGNTLDATDFGEGWLSKDASVSDMEQAWGNPVTTKANIDAIKNAGFNTIRIPVSWVKATDAEYNIRVDWMARVTEVVNYAAANDMYIILNTHHDDETFTLMNSNAAAGKAAFKKIWEQIADNFKNYDEKLIFEALNEPRTKGSSAEWNGGTAEERANLNSYYATFVDVVRKSGGNNGKRVLVITPYGASGTAAAMNGLTLPDDGGARRFIVNYHNYAPYNFALNTDAAYSAWSASGSNATDITDPMNRYHTKFVSQGTPVIIDEFGAMNKNNESTRAAWAKFYAEKAWEKGMKCVWWDNGVITGDGELFGLLDRNNNAIIYPALLDGLMSGTGNPVVPSDRITAGAWTWDTITDQDDGGSSTISLSYSNGAITASGNVADVPSATWNGANWKATPDAATLVNLRAANTISFKIKGDGKTYRIQLPTNDIYDFCYYVWDFSTTAGAETTVTVDISDFVQQDWGAQKPLNRDAIEGIEWQALKGNSIIGLFSVTIRDLQIF